MQGGGGCRMAPWELPSSKPEKGLFSTSKMYHRVTWEASGGCVSSRVRWGLQTRLQDSCFNQQHQYAACLRLWMGFRSPLHNPKSLQQAGGADRHPCCRDKTSWIGQECHIWIFLNRVCILEKMNCVTSSFEPITYYFYFAVSISKYLDHRHQLAFGCLWGAERHTWVRFCHAGTQGSSFGDI